MAAASTGHAAQERTKTDERTRHPSDEAACKRRMHARARAHHRRMADGKEATAVLARMSQNDDRAWNIADDAICMNPVPSPIVSTQGPSDANFDHVGQFDDALRRRWRR